MVVALHNLAISSPFLASVLTFGGAAHPLRSDCHSHLPLSLGSSPEDPGQAPKPVLSATFCAHPWGPHGTDCIPSIPPTRHAPRFHAVSHTGGQCPVLRSSGMPREGGASTAYPSLGFQTLVGKQDAYLLFNPFSPLPLPPDSSHWPPKSFYVLYSISIYIYLHLLHGLL